MFIPGCQLVEIERNCERLDASTKSKFLSLKKARLQAKKAGLKRKDVDDAIKQVRKESEDRS